MFLRALQTDDDGVERDMWINSDHIAYMFQHSSKRTLIQLDYADGDHAEYIFVDGSPEELIGQIAEAE